MMVGLAKPLVKIASTLFGRMATNSLKLVAFSIVTTARARRSKRTKMFGGDQIEQGHRKPLFVGRIPTTWLILKGEITFEIGNVGQHFDNRLGLG